jgi:hypothetical protein
MAKTKGHKWEFRPRFRRHSFGWRSQPAIKRVKEAVSEIKKMARKDQTLAAEGAVLFLEKVAPALEHVDSSSGAIGTAVNKAIEALAPIIAGAPADPQTRDGWLERLWTACEDDGIPYIELLGEHWGEVCASTAVASQWVDRLIGTCKLSWSPDPQVRGYFRGTTHCLSALLAAERYPELLELIEMAPYNSWDFRQYGVKALTVMGQKAEALRYAEGSHGLTDNPVSIARACEDILLSSGLADEAYSRYGIKAAQATTYLARFRLVAKKYPHKTSAEVLKDLVESTPGEEGKWFAAAKHVELFDEAITLANRSPTSPKTLTRAARDFAEKRPAFALEAGITALRWLVEGYGYEVTNVDVLEAYSFTIDAAKNVGLADQTQQRIRNMVAEETFGERFVTKVLGRELGLS